jgi:hypothetical protein
MDVDESGALDVDEFIRLWDHLKKWKVGAVVIQDRLSMNSVTYCKPGIVVTQYELTIFHASYIIVLDTIIGSLVYAK